MANTLVEYAKLATDALKKGIAQSIYQESAFLRRLPFIEIIGNSLVYNREDGAAGADFYEVGEKWLEGTPTWVQTTIALAILGGDADADAFIQATRKEQNIAEAVIALKAQAIGNKFDLYSILGQTTNSAVFSTTKAFKGLLRLIAECEAAATTDLDSVNNTQVMAMAADSGVLTLDAMDQLRDMVKPKPDAFLITPRMIRKVASLARASGTNMVHDRDALGFPVTRWGDQEIILYEATTGGVVADNLQDGASSVLDITAYAPTTARGAAQDNSPIFAVRFGDDGLSGLSNGMIQTEDIGKLEEKDATRTRIKFYCALALFNKRAAAVLINATDA